MPVDTTPKFRAIRARDRDPTEAKAKAATRVKPGPKPKEAHPSSAVLGQEGRKNLTNWDWLQVIQYHDKDSGIKQKAVVEYFASRSNAEGGKLSFTQGALSKHLNPVKKAALLALAAENSTALSLKRERVVTAPEVDRGLGLWVLNMEQKNRAVTGAMLIEQRKRLEVALNVPEERRLRGTGWVDSFKKAHGLSERRWHGEAGSVNLEAVEVERKRLPCDAGIIRCLKAHYCRALAIRALDLYQANDPQPFKIDILSGMQMLESVWNNVTPTTIANCWIHTKITPKETDEWEDIFVDPNAPDSSDSECDEPSAEQTASAEKTPTSAEATKAAWDVMLAFATTDMSLPQAEEQLQRVLGPAYYPKDWQAALEAVMACEGDAVEAELAVRDLIAATQPSESRTDVPQRRYPIDRNLREAEDALYETIKTLAEERCIRGILPSLDEILNSPIERQEPGSGILGFSDGDNTNEIIQHMQRVDQEEREAAAEEEEEPEFSFDKKEAIAAVDLLEKIARHRPDLDSTLSLGPQLRKMRVGITKEIEQGKKQVELTQFFK
ncbi:unnamed protein product [Mycena citricolor]|uniref:HTH CENPB-type domain-containing protein n=1 Tax=Mycena citricolor TaxID=2018698 RepID=A0AAD2HZ54_9AGAR|nr:unnamed protein product [Mycena citricolor]